MIYLTKILQQDQAVAETYIYAFAMVNYFTPIIGAIIADVYLGRYWFVIQLVSL